MSERASLKKKKKKKKNWKNAGRSRDRRHGQTVKAVTLFSGGTLTSHLSCLSVKRKEEGRAVEAFISCSTNLMTKHYP